MAVLAGLVGVSSALYIGAAGIDPWRWWIDYRDRAVAPAEQPARNRLHGPSGAVQPQPVGTDSSVSASPVRLRLTSTRLGRNAREGTVEIGVNANSPQTYRAGAILANGARIEEIRSDYVVLERDGQRARLYVEGHDSVDVPSANESLLSVGGADPAPRRMANSRDALTDVMRVTPVYAGESLQALEVYAADGSSAFSALGLEPGDRITSINGVLVSDAAHDIATLRRVTQGEALQVTITRQGTVQALSMPAVTAEGSLSASTR
jgi:general secretion pathway protein C